MLFRSVADEIRSSVYRELGITASIGVSYSKIVAKLGSDYRKPNGTTVIRRDNLKGMVWPLPAKDLFFVGPATNQKLQKHGIITIGDIANAGSAMLRSLLGKNGETIWEYANGLDTSLVVDKPSPIKSIGNRATYPRDLYIADEIKAGFWVLSEAVARRLRLHEFKAQTVSIYIRDKHLNSCERQMKVRRPTQLAHEIMETALALFNANRNFLSGAPVRSLGIKGMNLQAANKYTQLSFLPEEMKRQKWEAIELAMDEVRERIGHFAIQRGSLMLDAIGKINPFDDHTIHPVPYQ